MSCATPSRCGRGDVSSLRKPPLDPEWVDRWLRDMNQALPNDSHETIVSRTGIPKGTLDDMLEGRHVRLALSAGIESVRLCPAAPARALLGRLAGSRFAVIPAPGTSAPADVLSANGHLLGAVAEVEAALGDGLADGQLSESETIRIVAALAQAQGRITALLGSLGVRS